MTAIGSWTLTMTTPMGVQTGTLAITDEGGTLSGTMTDDSGDAQPVNELNVTDTTAKWKIAIKKPIPLTLHFDVTIDGDTLTGKFRPGMFPPSPVTGVRA